MHAYRTHTCGELRAHHIGQNVRLSGWIQNKRNLGGVLFITLRDHYGITQIIVPANSPLHKLLEDVRVESVIRVDGVVKHRGENNVNPNMPTGEIEVEANDIIILSLADQLPFALHDVDNTPETTRLTYRFLELRTPKLHNNIILRSKVIASIRRRMIELGFNEFQTPILTSSSPEGARDYLVPSRLYPGKFYALPQAPQQFKQLLMISGFDRYFQIAPCFRDEDARADRSPGEFYQLDLEMSFVTQEDVFEVVEKVMYGIFTEFSNAHVTPIPFPRLTYDEAMQKYGTDKPDLRINIEIVDVTEIFKESEIKAFLEIINNGGVVRAINVQNIANKSRKFFDDIENFCKSNGAKGLATLLFSENNEIKGSIAKFINNNLKARLLEKFQPKVGDGLLILADQDNIKASVILGKLRTHLADLLDLREKNSYRFVWITDFPMYELDSETNQITFCHNPFSMPQGGLEALETQDPLKIKAYQYDIVCNGVEIGSGAIRNHKPEIMYKAFQIAGYSKEEVDKKFGGMIRAFRYGAPPHGGIAPGIDRIVMLLANAKNIREVIAFPMNQNAQDLLMGAPSEVSPKQLEELHIRIVYPDQKEKM